MLNDIKQIEQTPMCQHGAIDSTSRNVRELRSFTLQDGFANIDMEEMKNMIKNLLQQEELQNPIAYLSQKLKISIWCASSEKWVLQEIRGTWWLCVGQ